MILIIFYNFSEEWLNKQLLTRQAEFTDVQNITYGPMNCVAYSSSNLFFVSIFCGTWNVNGKMPAESLDGWLSTPKQRPDIYAIGYA